jgi:hypothetical protein
VHDLPTRLARARLVFLLGRRRPLFDRSGSWKKVLGL